ncbi:helix-turn-helix transcriptional regulator [Streptococcus catagoni]|nr:helix-turn-helix transcriptional regulator [Streptococcus catagoni]
MPLTIGEMLKKNRQERSLTQEEIARHLNVSRQTVSN